MIFGAINVDFVENINELLRLKSFSKSHNLRFIKEFIYRTFL